MYKCSMPIGIDQSSSSPPQKELSLVGAFILALLRDGRGMTLYELKSIAMIPTGASLPALRKLMAKGMIEAQGEKVGQKLYYISPRGRQTFEKVWFSFARRPARDLGEALRSAFLPYALGKMDLAAECLREAARARESRATALERGNVPAGAPVAETFEVAYSKVKSTSLQAEAYALRALAKEIHGSKSPQDAEE